MSKITEKYKKLSKYLSYILRHHPEKADLELDRKGFTRLDSLLGSLDNTKYSWAGKSDIEYLIKNSNKERFEIKSNKIRALYGHSVEVNIKDSTEPPTLLYHGTSPNSLDSILEEGLKSMNRQYVHLSKSKDEAYKVGKRHHNNPIILEIEAKSAWKEGIEFFEKPDVVLAKNIPPKYISIYEK